MAKLGGTEVQTRFAREAGELAADFEDKLSALRLGGKYRPVLTAPEVDSTGGGAQSGQPILLAAESGPTVLVGYANIKNAQVDLRSVTFVDQVHRERHDEPFAVSPEEYERFLQYARQFFEGHDLRVDVRYPPSLPPPRAARVGKGRGAIAIAVMAVIVAVAAAVLFAIRR